MKLAIIFGGKSTEHNISVVSATSIISNLDQDKYDIYPIYISKKGEFYKYLKNIKDIKILNVNNKIKEIEKIINIEQYLKQMDLVFPVLHGLNGEDGTIQGMLEILNKKYVGCKVLASALCMDKVSTKQILKSINIKVAKSITLIYLNNTLIYLDNNFNKFKYDIDRLNLKIKEYLKYPVFIKPSKGGSSIGINKAHNKKELIKYLKIAFKYDQKVLIEEEIKGQEVECAILENDDLIVSTVGEIVSNSSFYSYDAKYKNNNSKIIIPAKLDKKIIKKVQQIAKKAFAVCNCQGLARIDFFIENKTNNIILNEINTMPGFTLISMYPKLMQEYGFTFQELLDKLIYFAKK